MIVRFISLLTLLLIVGACDTSDQIPPNTLIIALESGPRNLDPRLATDAASSKVRDLIFNGLVKRNDDLSLAPDLAERWQMPTPTRYLFHLRKGILFHNGQPLTSRDVKAQYEWVLDKKNRSPYRGGLEVIEKITTPDDFTVEFALSGQSAPFLGALTMGIMPADTDADMAAKTPIGTGPFSFVSHKAEESLTLTRFDKYFDGAAKLKNVMFKVVPDETVRTLELESGGLHIITNPITPDLLPRLRSRKNLIVKTALGTNFSYLGFNMNDRLTGNREVRRALAHAIDRGSVIKHLLKDLARPATGPLSPANEFYYGDVTRYEYNPELAKKILDEAGYPDPDGDGPQVRFSLEYSTSQNETRKRIAEVFQWQLQAIGVGLTIRASEWGTFYDNIKKGNFQMFSLTWVGVADPDILRYIFHSSSVPPGGANRGRYHNNRLDKLLEEGGVTTGEARHQKYAEVQKILADDLPYIPLWYAVNVAVIDRRVTGFVVAPDENLKSLKDVTMNFQRFHYE